MKEFYIEVEDKRTGKRLVLDSSLMHGAGIKSIKPGIWNNTDNVSIFRKSIEEWLRLADKITLHLKDASIDKKTYFDLISTFWTITEIAVNDQLMKGIFSDYSVQIIQKLHQLRDYQAKSGINEKANIETMRGSVIKLMAD